MLGLKKNLNILADYDPSWEAAFIEERKRLARVLGEFAKGIEHYGSTAVSGMRGAAIRAAAKQLSLSARVARASCWPSHIPGVPELDLKRPSKGRSGPEPSEARARGAYRCCVRSPQRMALPPAGPGGRFCRGHFGTEGVW
jgi:hypothetical protein